MEKRDVKKITVEFADGETKTFETVGMFYVSHYIYPAGAKTTEDGYDSHEVRWIDRL